MLSGHPRVSVLLPVYNGQRYVARAVRSILQQTFTDFELIVINDGSTDGTASILECIRDSRLTVVHQENCGVARALNVGIQSATGTYIARMDADDISVPTRLAIQVMFLDDYPAIGIVGSNCSIQHERGGGPRHVDLPLDDTEIRRTLLWRNPFVHSTVMMRKSVLDRAGRYNPRYKWEDYDLWFRILSLSKGANLPYQLVTRTDRHCSVSHVPKHTYYQELARIQLAALLSRYAPIRMCIPLLRSFLAYMFYECRDFFRESF